MDAFNLETPIDSFEISYKSPNRVRISSHSKNGLLWRGEAFDKKLNLIDCLKKVFTTGFTQRDEQSVLANLSSLKQQQLSVGTYGYTYLIDTSKKNIREENLRNTNFVANCSEKKTNEGPDAINSKLNPKCILGAVPSVFVAFALGVAERSFIANPDYQGIFNLSIIKEVSDNSQFLMSTLSLQYPDLPIDEVYRNYLSADEEIAVRTNSSSAFFPRQPRSLELPSTSSNEYNSYQCGRKI